MMRSRRARSCAEKGQSKNRVDGRKIHSGSCRYQQHNVDRSPPDEFENNSAFKKRCVDGSTECLIDRLPEDILHDILSRLSICELFRARGTCVAWHGIISSCDIFQQLYDERNQESWFALTGHPHNHNDCCFFNNSNNWSIFHATYLADPTTTWLLNGAADGLMLFVSDKGKMVVANALTRRLRHLPDTKVTPRLRLELCLKKTLWRIDSKHSCASVSVQPSPMSVNIVVDRPGKTFKVIVCGELRTNQVHALVYTSATNTWSTKLCTDIDCKIFRRPFHSTVSGNTIYFVSMHRSSLAYYNTETGVFVLRRTLIPPDFFIPSVLVEQVQIIKMMVYREQIFLLSIIVTRDFNLWHDPSALVGLWQANHTSGQWEFLTAHALESPTVAVAAAYDGNQSVLIVQGMPGSKMIFLNLDTKEWRMSGTDNQAWTLLDGNARPLRPGMITFSPDFSAFYLKLKFCAAL